eukprot:COSAG02_NODE_14429_length_1273_cov_3.115843_1_plen_86_part_10
MGNAKSTSTHDLDRTGHALLGDFYRGAYPAGSEPEPDGTRHIVLLFLIVAFWTLLLSALPYVVATGNIFISLILTFFPVPLIIVAP